MHAAGFQHAHHLDLRLTDGLGLKHMCIAKLPEPARCLACDDFAENPVERGKLAEFIKKRLSRLELMAGQAALAGPASGVQQLADSQCPCRGQRTFFPLPSGGLDGPKMAE